jgi:UDP-N-acetylmuramoyl-tripeptide--D-alanyl-D-alanine ligase
MKTVFRTLLVIITAIAALALAYYIIHHKPFHKTRLTDEILSESFTQGRSFLLANQKEAGNFNYEYDFIDQKLNEQVSPVRQAGALWGMALVHQAYPSDETNQSILKGIQFYANNSIEIDSTKRLIQYPKTFKGSTGTMALSCLAIIDFLRAEEDCKYEEELRSLLDSYIQYVLTLRMENGQFHSKYAYYDGSGVGKPSPYFDGETLLMLCKAAKYMGYDSLQPLILESAENMYQKNVVEARQEVEDSDITKGFYQWGSMAFFEIFDAGWDDKYSDRVIDLAYWMIDTHKTLYRFKNTAYAHEGMIHAWEIARWTGNLEAQKKIGKVIDKGLYKLTSWQINGPNENLYLLLQNNEDPLANGGIMNYCCDTALRIDVTQHQMHAVHLARKYIYAPDSLN